MRAFLALLSLAAAANARKCSDITIPVTISARNGLFNQTAPQTDIDVTNFILNITEPNTNYTATVFNRFNTVSGTYTLAATYCQPNSGPSSIIQVLTHGIAFDRRYWDEPTQRFRYSYVKQAVDNYGFSTLAYDRLGIGESQRGEPVNEIQAWLEVAALAELTRQLRAGSVPSVPKFNKVVHVGHSFGSVQSYQLTVDYPELSDGVILTGFSQNGAYIPYFALGGNFVQANTNSALKSYVDGYLAGGDASGVQTNFFSPYPEQFDPKLLRIAYKTGQPVTVGELLTIGSLAQAPNRVAAPVLIITGQRDIPFCGGNCLNVGTTGFASIPAASAANFPNATAFEAFIVPKAGHGLNLEYSSKLTYKTILDFLVSNGLKP